VTTLLYLLAGAVCGTVGGYLMFICPHKRKPVEKPSVNRPIFAYMESIHAGGASKWHMRRLPPDGVLKLGGGITTPSLCGKVTKGWDLAVPLSGRHERHTCEECTRIYLATFRDPV